MIKVIWRDRKRTIFGLPISFTVYILTESKLITRRGFFTIVEDEIELYKIADKKLVLPFWQRVFRCGTIHIHVADVDTPLKIVQSIKKPRTVLDHIDKCMNIQKDKYGTRGRDVMGSADVNSKHEN